MRRFFGPILLGAIVVGLVLPIDLGPYLTVAIWTELFLLIFFSYFQINWKVRDLLRDSVWVSLFYLLRFVLLPVAVYGVLAPVSAFYANVLFLLVLAPAGISAPALTGLFGGSVEVSMLVLIVSSLLCPLVLPLLCVVILGSQVEINTQEMLTSLLITLVLPFVLHLPLRRIPAVMRWARKVGTPVNIVLMGTLAWLITGKNQALIFAQPLTLLQHFGVLLLSYAFLYGLAFVWKRNPREKQIGYSVASGANNIALVMALGYTYFAPEVGFFFVAGVIVWTAVLVPVERLLRRLRP